MALGLSPFLYAGVLQVLELSGGELIQEVGEAPRKMQQGGMVGERANRGGKHSKRAKKGKKRKR